MSKNPGGKGDKNRSFGEAYRKGYDLIDWSKKPKPKPKEKKESK